jgi:cyclopropane fatty-acyl-phospholipid synthase-like methyltransferase
MEFVMSDKSSPMEVLQSYFEARSLLEPLLLGTQLLGLLQGAYDSGILGAARTPVTVEQIASKTGVETQRVSDICHALDAHDVFVKENNLYRLDDRWAVLTSSEAVFPFENVLADTFAQAKVYANSSNTYWTMSTEERVALAKGVMFNPASSLSPATMEAWIKEVSHDLHTMFLNGARYLELGCGIAGGMLSLLQACPRLRAVGIELADDVLAEARHQAEVLGVSDRVDFYQDDARNFKEKNAFDCVFWSQFFFPEASREATLKVAFNALKPGGVIASPLLDDPAIVLEDLHSVQGKYYALARLMYGGWNIPALSAEDVRREFEAAGFVETRIAVTSMNRNVIGYRPQNTV